MVADAVQKEARLSIASCCESAVSARTVSGRRVLCAVCGVAVSVGGGELSAVALTSSYLMIVSGPTNTDVR